MAVTNYMERIAAAELAKRPIQAGLTVPQATPASRENETQTAQYLFRRFGGPLITSPLAIMAGIEPIPAPPKPSPLRPYDDGAANKYLMRRFGSNLPTSTISIMGGLRRPFQPDGKLAPPTTGLAASLNGGAMGMLEDSVGNVGASIGGLVRGVDVALHGNYATAPKMRDYLAPIPGKAGINAPTYHTPPVIQDQKDELRNENPPADPGNTPTTMAFRRLGLLPRVEPGTGYVETDTGRTYLDGRQEGSPSRFEVQQAASTGHVPEAASEPPGMIGIGSSITDVNRLVGQPQWVVEGSNGDSHLGFGDRTRLLVRNGRVAGIQYANPEQTIATGQKYVPDAMEIAERNAAIDRASPEEAKYRREAGLRQIDAEVATAKQTAELASKERQVKMGADSHVTAAMAGGHYERNENGELVYMPGKVSGLQREGGTAADAKAYEATVNEFKTELEELNLQLKEARATGIRTDPAEQAIIDRLLDQISIVKNERKNYARRLAGVGLKQNPSHVPEQEQHATPVGIARPRTQREYDLLPVGAPYIDPVSGQPTSKQAKQK